MAVNFSGLRPITDDGPARVRDTDIQTVYSQYQQLRSQDPDREKRTMILKAYCRDPYVIEEENCIVQGYGANYGELSYKVDTKVQVAVDFLTERPTAFTITTNHREENLDPEVATYHSVRYGELITQAFDRYFIKRWDKWKYNIQSDATSWNMWGKAFEYWPDPKSPHSMPIYAGDVYPDSEASMFMDDWDTVYIRMDLYAWQLWRMAQQQEDLWDRKNLIYVLKYAFKQFKWDEEQILRGFSNHSLDYSLQNRKLSVIVMLVKEYEPNSEGKQISRYIMSEEWPAFTGSDQTTAKNNGFLFKQEFAFSEFSDTLSMLTDQIGTGFYYNNPSFASQIYIGSYEYDRLLNKAMRGADISTMLIIEAQNAQSRDKIAQNTLQDSIILDSNTKMSQTRLQIPIGEVMQLAGKVQSDLSRGIQAYEIGTPNPAGGSTPITKAQDANNMAQAQGAQSMYLKWMNQNYGRYGRQLYKRFITDKSGPTSKDLKDFKKFLKTHEVPEECWDLEYVEIVSTGMQGAGNPTQRFQQAVNVMDILDRTVTSKGAETAKRDAIAALVGADKTDEYIQGNMKFPTEQERLISMENAALSTLTQEVVRPDDYHPMHFAKHTESAMADLKSAEQFIQMQANDIDKGIDLNEASRSLLKAQFKAAHSGVHLQYISKDPRYKGAMTELQGALQAISKKGDQLEAQANQMAQAREKKMAELNGTDPEVEKQKQLADIAVNEAQQLSQIKLGSEIEKHQFNEDRAKRQASVNEELQVSKTASEIAQSEAKGRIDLTQKAAKGAISINEQRAKAKAKTERSPSQ